MYNHTSLLTQTISTFERYIAQPLRPAFGYFAVKNVKFHEVALLIMVFDILSVLTNHRSWEPMVPYCVQGPTNERLLLWAGILYLFVGPMRSECLIWAERTEAATPWLDLHTLGSQQNKNIIKINFRITDRYIRIVK